MEPIWTHPDQEPEDGQQLDHQELVHKANKPNGFHTGQVSPVMRQPKHMQRKDMLHLLQCAMPRIHMFTSGQDTSMSDEQFMAIVKSFLLDPAQFVAGTPRHHLPAWQQYFSEFGLNSKASAVLQWVQHTVSFEFVHPFSDVQKRHPRYNERVQLVQDLLCKTVGAESVNALLDRDTPGQVQLLTEFHAHTIVILLGSNVMSCWHQGLLLSGTRLVQYNHKLLMA